MIGRIQERMTLCVLKMLNISGNSIDSLAVRYNKTFNDAEKAEEFDKVYLSACFYRINSTSLSSSGYNTIQFSGQYFADTGAVKFILLSCFSLKAL